MLYFKKTLLFLFLIISAYLSYAFADIYNFSYINWTAYLNFNWQVNWVNYAVKPDFTKIFNVTWSDSNLYQCFKLYGTWYTDTLWEVFFSYNGTDSYICADWKWRWYAKLWAWWWLEFEDLKSDDWKVYTNKMLDSKDVWYYYSSRDWEWNWTWNVLTNGLWLWIWNYVKTDNQPRSAIYEFVDIEKSILSISSWKIANGTDSSILNILVKDKEWNPINWFWAESISFYTWDSVFFYDNGVWNISWLFFDWLKSSLWNISMPSWKFQTSVYSILSNSGSVNLKFSIWEKFIVLKWKTNFKSPLASTFSLIDWDSNWKLLMWYNEKWTIDITWPAYISNIKWKWTIQTQWNWDYLLNSWKDWNWEFSFIVNLVPYSEDTFVDNKLSIAYNLNWTYDIDVNWTIFKTVPYINLTTNSSYLYPQKIIERISLSKNCDDKRWNWVDLCNLKVKLLNEKGYSIPNLKFALSIDDAKKTSTVKSSTFDIDESTASYENWLFLQSYENTTDSYWDFDLNLYSYKPVISWSVLFKISWISWIWDIYNWAQPDFNWAGNWIFFNTLLDFAFSGEALYNILKMWIDNPLSVVFNKLVWSDDLSNPSYSVKWTFAWCNDCYFNKWDSLSQVWFGSKNITLNFSWSNDPDYIYYNIWTVNYTLNWTSWAKNIKLISRLWINNKPLKDSSWLFLLWSANMWYNMTETSKYNWSLNLFGSDAEISKAINKIRLSVAESSRSVSRIDVTTDYHVSKIESMWLKYFQCSWNSRIIIWDGSTDIKIKGDNKIVAFDCPIYVKSNLLKQDSNSKLNIVSIAEKDDINYASLTWRRLNSNLYVYPDVKTIFSNISTNWSLFFLTDNNDPSFDNIFIKDRIYGSYLKNQILIKWKLISRNILWWGYKVNNKFYLPWGKVVTKYQNIFGQSDVKAEDIVKSYDINFWRINYINKNTNKYDPSKVSDYVKSQFVCSWDISDDKMCYMPVIVESDLWNN